MEKEKLPLHKKEIYNTVGIFIGALLGGPVACGYMMSENYQVLGDPEKATRAFFIPLTAIIFLPPNFK